MLSQCSRVIQPRCSCALGIQRLMKHLQVGQYTALSCDPLSHSPLPHRSRDAAVNFWTLPDPSTPSSPSIIGPPVSLNHVSEAGSADLTSLHWSPDGQLLAVGSYDAILRICRPDGELYFTHSQHNVSGIHFIRPPLFTLNL